MSLYYTHTLIPTAPDFAPTAAQVQSFLAAMLTRGATAADDATFTLRPPPAEPAKLATLSPARSTSSPRRITGRSAALPT